MPRHFRNSGPTNSGIATMLRKARAATVRRKTVDAAGLNRVRPNPGPPRRKRHAQPCKTVMGRRPLPHSAWPRRNRRPVLRLPPLRPQPRLRAPLPLRPPPVLLPPADLRPVLRQPGRKLPVDPRNPLRLRRQDRLLRRAAPVVRRPAPAHLPPARRRRAVLLKVVTADRPVPADRIIIAAAIRVVPAVRRAGIVRRIRGRQLARLRDSRLRVRLD